MPSLDINRASTPGHGPPAEDSAAARGLSVFQLLAVAVVVAGLAAAIRYRPEAAGAGLVVLAGLGFVANAAWRVTLVCFSLRRPPEPAPPPAWPRYTILAALHDEAEVVDQLVRRLSAIDYPADRLQGFLVLEADDAATQAAARASPLPGWLSVLIVPEGRPRTKPRALNHALAAATGDLLTVYDAEDDPDPGQLREAAARFAADPSGRLACLQAPLRIRRRAGDTASPFLDRQFAAEYASLFETALPGLARLGLPFPLGGTSNHFRVEVLRAVGGWDAWNVTEDADLGFRLWRRGYRSGVINRPTWETPPGSLEAWLPQRTSCVPYVPWSRTHPSDGQAARCGSVVRRDRRSCGSSVEESAWSKSSGDGSSTRRESMVSIRVGNGARDHTSRDHGDHRAATCIDSPGDRILR